MGQKFQSTSGDNVAIKVVVALAAYSLTCIGRNALSEEWHHSEKGAKLPEPRQICRHKRKSSEFEALLHGM